MRRRVLPGLLLLGLLIAGAMAPISGQAKERVPASVPSAAAAPDAGYLARHYTLALTVDVHRNTIAGRVTITCRATRNLTRFSLDFTGFRISTVTVDRAPASISRIGTKLFITPAHSLPMGRQFVVAVTYSGVPTTIREPYSTPVGPATLGWHNTGDGVYVDNIPDGAMTWFPVNDDLRDKATYTFRITAPSPYTAVANGDFSGATAHGTTRTYVWKERFPMVASLTQVAVGRFTLETSVGPHSLPIHLYVPLAVADRARSRFALLPHMIAYDESFLGWYPFDVWDGVLVDQDFRWALETQTCTLFSREVTTMNAEAAQEGIAHELAHQWFADSVTPSSWHDIWLNEGFATYLSWLWFEHIHDRPFLDDIMRRQYGYLVAAPEYDLLLQHPSLSGRQVFHALQTILRLTGQSISSAALQRALGITSPDQLTSAQALSVLGIQPGSADAVELHKMALSSAPANPPADDLFAQSVYIRGAMTLQALRVRVGDPVFFRILRTYTTRYRYANVTTHDFIAMASEASGHNLTSLFQTWLYAAPAPPMPPLLPTQ
jgi:aminopeptidase N